MSALQDTRRNRRGYTLPVHPRIYAPAKVVEMARFDPKQYNPATDCSDELWDPKSPAIVLSQQAGECRCGCRGRTGSIFLPGHDARLRGKLIRAYRTDTPIIVVDANQKRHKKDPLDWAMQLGWAASLTRWGAIPAQNGNRPPVRHRSLTAANR